MLQSDFAPVKPAVPLRVTVIGAANVDITGTPWAPLIERDSNPGRISVTYGGVGRNLAENLARLGLAVELVTVLGDDHHADAIRRNCAELGISLKHSLTVAGRATSSYLCLNDENGDMRLAVNDMSLYDALTPDQMTDRLPVLNSSRLVVVDANLAEDTIKYIADHCQVPILAEPVSCHKAGRLLPVLSRLHLIKPNRIEAESLSGVSATDDQGLKRAADALLANGVGQVCISLGGEGVYAADSAGQEKIRPFPAQVVNTTGCGDAFMAACVWGVCHDLPLPQIARLGLASAAICIEYPGSVNPELSSERLITRAGL